jgi:ectoine hydroxylase
MDPECLQFALTEDEKINFERDGYLVVENALEPELTERLIEIMHRLHRDGEYDPPGTSGHSGDPRRHVRTNYLGTAPIFMELLVHPTIFPKVWGILGWNIKYYTGDLTISVQETEGSFEPNGKTFGWHQDSGRSSLDMYENAVPARLSIKVGYFLTDVSESGRGNFWIIPGSHLKRTIDLPPNGVGQPDGAMPVLVKPGTAVFFDRRIWHCATKNYSPITRMFITAGYGYRWISPRDEMTVPPEVFERADPIQRQLLGFSAEKGNTYAPEDADVPLRVWLEEHQPGAVLWRV